MGIGLIRDEEERAMGMALLGKSECEEGTMDIALVGKERLWNAKA